MLDYSLIVNYDIYLHLKLITSVPLGNLKIQELQIV